MSPVHPFTNPGRMTWNPRAALGAPSPWMLIATSARLPMSARPVMHGPQAGFPFARVKVTVAPAARANAKPPTSAQQWFDAAQEVPGSWWSDWAAWLASHAGKRIAAPRAPGNRTYQAIEPAPGRYVKAKA